ncbi:MAG TPA: c-type cytochrome biogenesis protein CcmI [Parvibaculum sp.]|uniref:c-type cytochrome biogenesis protein CcmI n=1 Tax=Parvibaculum sp. TaxID=2024848 RepID=UPI002CB4C868|nr:c-type cytochrome biogenesis protein CcmI [Parvibaculum sp.]HMM13941.1 c-type cytochrome biogenesis protein CcmI [Parvibaculum sp.]
MSENVSEMLLWLFFAAMTAAVIVAILRPLTRRMEADFGRQEVDLYKDQLAEISRDLERGVLEPAEAEAAKVEVSRRLIAAADGVEKRKAARGGGRALTGKFMAMAVIITVPAFALVTYLMLGSPELPDQPFKARMSAPVEQLPLEALVLRVEQHLKEDPQDLRGWEVLAPAYIRQQKYAEAKAAWSRAIALGGENAGRLAARGEAAVLEAGGVVVPAARQDFVRAAALDPREPRTQYYLGLAEIEDGKKDAAIKRWKALLASASADASWRRSVEAELAALENPGQAAPGPSAEQVGAAAQMSPEARQEMIEGMVSNLAARLEEAPNDLPGWLRLIRAYGVLGKRVEADAALARARKAFAADASALASLDEAEKALPTK